jgi:tRNA-dihydrouridine synthase B
VVGNGDIITPQAAKKMLDETGCAGVSIGRGAFYDPWIFRRTLAYLKAFTSDEFSETANLSASQNVMGSHDLLVPEPPFAERVRVMRRHLDLMVEVFGEELGCRMFRKVAPWYAKRFGPCHEFNKKVVQVSTKAQFDEVLGNYIRWREQFLDDSGELLPRFQPTPMVASFMRGPAPATREHIPVPKGPVEVW